MTDTLLNSSPSLSADSNVAGFNLHQPLESLTIFGKAAPTALLDPFTAPIEQVVKTWGVGDLGLSLTDLTSVGGLSSNRSSITELEDSKVPSLGVDSLLGFAPTSSLVHHLWKVGHQKESIAPLLTVGLFNDTGISNSDKLTRNPSIQGTVKDDSRITQIRAQVDGGQSYNISGDLRRSGKFYLDRQDIFRINGGQKLNDGQHTIKIEAADLFGNKSSTSIDFTLDTLSPIKPGFALTSASDTGILGDYKTTLDRATLNGITEANANITLTSGTATQTIQADAKGQFTFTDVALNLGDNKLKLEAVDAAGNKSSFSKSVSRTDIDAGDVITDWNATTLRAIQSSKTAPPIAAYNLAMVHTAVFDAVNSIEHKFNSYHIDGIAPTNASAEAAAASAAHRILVNLYPTQTSIFDAQLVKSLVRVADGTSEDDGVKFGESIADQFLAWRKNDGSEKKGVYTPGAPTPTDWKPTSPTTLNPLLPEWGKVTPFAMTSGSQFRPVAPPTIDSAQFTSDYNQTKELGSINSTTRTADQTETAKFWADGGGTYTPPGHWNQLAEQITAKQHTSLIDNARLFASLNISLADAGISCWDAKYTYNTFRPVTAIQNGDKDSNLATVGDATWQPLLATPPFPEYTSGHSTFSGAASTVLSSFFGNDYTFSTTSLGLPGTTRKFTSFSQAADEAGMSRIYGGIHFMSANQAGLKAGRELGSYVVNNFVKTV